MLGALGAVTATTPAESLLASIGWRGLFDLLAIVSAVCVVLIYLLVPEIKSQPPTSQTAKPIGLKSIYCDPRFWRLAPLSATCIGSAWALHGLWAAPWLADVAGLDQPAVVRHLFIMAVAACAGALFLGLGADWLGRQHGKSEGILAVAAALFIAAQFALALGWPVPTAFVWAIVAGVGAATVLSFAILAEHFPNEIAGRANAALNLLHVGGAFVLQSGIGLVIDQWTPESGHYPPAAYQTAFAVNIALQIAAFLWFVRPPRQIRTTATEELLAVAPDIHAQAGRPLKRYQLAERAWADWLVTARAEASRWRLVALATGVLTMLSAVTLIVSARQARVAPHIVTVERLGILNAADLQSDYFQPSDAQIAFVLSRFIEDIRSLSTDPVVVRSKWARAFDMTTDRGAEALKAYARNSGRFANIGARAITAEVTSIVRASNESFEVHWAERTYEHKAPMQTERFTGVITLVRETTEPSPRRQNNPFGVLVDGFESSQEDN